MLSSLAKPPHVVLQNGALFAPGRPCPFPYVLLLDNTCLLAEQQPPVPEADIGKFISFGKAWLRRGREAPPPALAVAALPHPGRRSPDGGHPAPTAARPRGRGGGHASAAPH